jgi:hypothetical protein
VKVVNCIAGADRRMHGRNLKKCNYVAPPDNGFLETETYVGVFLVDFKKPYIGFLNIVHLVGSETLISENAR